MMNESARLIQNPAMASPRSQPQNPSSASSNLTNCPSCGANLAPNLQENVQGWVYSIGRIVPQIPDLGVEKEFSQLGKDVAAQAGGPLKVDELIEVLEDPENAYLSRQLCWIFMAGDIEAFTLVCQDDTQARRLVEALPSAEDAEKTVQVVVGTVGYPGAASPCSASGLPAVWIDHHLSFTLDEFIDALSAERHEADEENGEKPDENFRAAARDLYSRLTRRSNNLGMTDEHRAMNYVALRYPPLYQVTADAYKENKTLVKVEARHSPSSSRRIVAIRLVLRDRRTDVVEHYQCLVDVTNRFPFLAAPLSLVYD